MRYIIYLVILVTPVYAWGNLGLKPSNLPTSKLELMSSKMLDDSFRSPLSFVHKGILGLGLRNFRLEYQANIRYRRMVELGVGIGRYNNTVKFFSASDEHKVSVESTPTYATLTIYPFHGDNKAFYIKGNYGLVNNMNSKRNKNEKGINHKMFQVGVGFKYLMPEAERYIFFELAKYTSTAKGIYTDLENYNSVTDYNLTFHAITFSVGIDINRY